MGSYTKNLTTSNSEKVILEAKFSWRRFTSTIICFALSLLFLAILISNMNHPEDPSSILYDPDIHIKFGIIFMYPFVWGCIKLRDILSQEVALTIKRLIIKTGASDEKTFDLPINIIQTIQIKGNSLSVYSMNGSVVRIKHIKNILQLREAIQELLDAKETLSNADLQTQALLGISQLNFKKKKSGCLAWAFWIVFVPLMGCFFGMLFRP